MTDGPAAGLAARLAPKLAEIVGPRAVLARSTQLLAYQSDGLPGYHYTPGLAVFPSTRDQVIAVIRLLADERVPFVPRGAGTGLSGGALADGTVLLGLNRLTRILSINPDERIAVVEPGVVNAALNRALVPSGLMYAPDPSSETACTIGGNIAENAGGPHCLKYGVTLNHVLAATIVTPDGDVATLGDPSRHLAGYDVLGAFVGSEGCFGVVVEATVHLTKRPPAIRTLLADFLSVDDAARATSAIIASGVVPAALEFMDGAMIRAVESSIYAAGYPADAAAVLLIELDGTPPTLDDDAELIRALCAQHAARTVRLASTERERAALWLGRKKAFGAMGRIAPQLVLQDAVIPRTQLAPILARIGEIATTYGVTICNVFHAGDGNLHPSIAYDGSDPEQSERVHRAMTDIMHACIAAGGSITGEHGVGLDKMAYMPELFTPDTLAAMCQVRETFDPERRANPGKVVPVHACKEWHVTPQLRNADEKSSSVTPLPIPTPSSEVEEPIGEYALRDQLIAEQVSEAVHEATSLRIVGHGTWLDGGHPVDAWRILSLAGDRGIVAYVPGDLTITVRAGTTLAEINDALRAHGQWLPLDPLGSANAITIGAIVATGAYGPLAEWYGTPRDMTLGLTVVTGTGAILHTGGRVVKNVAGFDLTRLMTGAWGSLGVITQVTLRVRGKRATAHAEPDPAMAHLYRSMPEPHGVREATIAQPKLAVGLKERFDPARVLNPGIMGML